MTRKKQSTSRPVSPNKLCTSCRRTCKQASTTVVAKCPRYYPFKNKPVNKNEFTWKQLELGI